MSTCQKPGCGPREYKIPEGDDRQRLVCPECEFICYENPKIVVGAVCSWEDKILLCKRAIEPRMGYWTLPAGYMELNETPDQGAAREAWEEARAKIEIDCLLGVFNVPQISQVQLIYRATLITPDVAAGPESQDVGLYKWDDIPWDDIAFPTVNWALEEYRSRIGQTDFPPASRTAEHIVSSGGM